MSINDNAKKDININKNKDSDNNSDKDLDKDLDEILDRDLDRDLDKDLDKDLDRDSNNNIYVSEILKNIGKRIGAGSTRAAFICTINDSIIIKMVRKEKYTYANKLEYDIWKKYENTEYSKYFCPILGISYDNKYLIMKKATKIIKNNFTDEEFLKYENEFNAVKNELKTRFRKIRDIVIHNFGIYENRVVCIDYAHVKNICLL
jgi:hypothetical protein